MEERHSLQVKWDGELLLNYIKWNKISFQEFSLTPDNYPHIRKNWNNHLRENPNDYDGNLLFLDSFQYKNDYLQLNVSLIKFSTVIYMVKKKIPVNKGIGVCGTQYLVFSPNRKHILVGERSLTKTYFPGVTTCPGGLLESNDLAQKPEVSLLRELYEEVNLPFKSENMLIAILGGWNGVSVTFLISTVISESFNYNPNELIHAQHEEWEGNLRWHPIEELKKIHPDQMLDGLTYYKSKVML
ncbi:MAG: NUDIX hydrolase [Candidatus Thorarchaeota archaeon]